MTEQAVHFSDVEKPAKRLNVERVREDFPILKQKVHGKPLIYLDNAASTQKPANVIHESCEFNLTRYANIHRGVHKLAELATEMYEGTREKLQKHLNAKRREEIIFVRGTTEGINLVANAYGRAVLHEGDEVLITHMEHHSNIVPWQIICAQTGAKLRVAPIDDAGELMMDEFEKLLNKRTKIVAAVHVSNALGTINPVKDIIRMAHERGAVALIDGAQAAPHMAVDVQDLDCDFYTISGHKMYGPTGIGALYGKYDLLAEMPPYQSGGDMIVSVTFEKTIYAKPPARFEAGTPNITGAVGFGAAIDYIHNIGQNVIVAYEKELLEHATRAISAIPGVRIIGNAREKAGLVSFVIDGIHPHDIGTILDKEGIAIRVGHHCAQPVMDRFNVPATARASFGIYNTKAEIDKLAEAIFKVKEVFA